MELHPSKRILEIYPDAILLPDSIGWFNRLQFTDPENGRKQIVSRLKLPYPSLEVGQWVCAGMACLRKSQWGHGKVVCKHLEALKEVIE